MINNVDTNHINNALHNILLNCIIPLLYRNNTNPTILIFRSVNKACMKRLCDLVYVTFNLADPSYANDMVSCNLVDGIIFPGYDDRIMNLEWNVAGIPILKPRPYAGNLIGLREDVLLYLFSSNVCFYDKLQYGLLRNWRDSYIYDHYQSSLPLILDQSIIFERRLELVETYIHPLSDFFNDKHTAITFYVALIGVGIVSETTARRLEPYIDVIIDSWLDSVNMDIIALVTIARYLDGFGLIFDRLQKYIPAVKSCTTKLRKLLVACLELDKLQTLKYLDIHAVVLPSDDLMFQSLCRFNTDRPISNHGNIIYCDDFLNDSDTCIVLNRIGYGLMDVIKLLRMS